MPATNDPDLVRAEYADESRFAVRTAVWRNATGPSPVELTFRAVAEVDPARVLEVGCGRVPDVDPALAELARVLRPGGRLVATTNSARSLPELRDMFGATSRRQHVFAVEGAEAQLRPHFATVERRDAEGTVTFPDWEAANAYVAAAVTRRDLAGKLPRFDGPLVCSRLSAVFVAETAA